MFIFERPLVAPLLALAIAAILVILDTLTDLSALFASFDLMPGVK